jgi:hypothetical protein
MMNTRLNAGINQGFHRAEKGSVPARREVRYSFTGIETSPNVSWPFQTIEGMYVDHTKEHSTTRTAGE